MFSQALVCRLNLVPFDEHTFQSFAILPPERGKHTGFPGKKFEQKNAYFPNFGGSTWLPFPYFLLPIDAEACCTPTSCSAPSATAPWHCPQTPVPAVEARRWRRPDAIGILAWLHDLKKYLEIPGEFININ